MAKHKEALAILREIRGEALADARGMIELIYEADAKLWVVGADCLQWLGRENEALA